MEFTAILEASRSWTDLQSVELHAKDASCFVTVEFQSGDRKQYVFSAEGVDLALYLYKKLRNICQSFT